jgi:hypothetical protein
LSNSFLSLTFQGIHVKNFTDSWQDGRAFCGLINVLKPAHIDLGTRTAEKAEENMDMAFNAAEEHFEFPKVSAASSSFISVAP